ncbi:MAG: hypothetical protein L6Q35_08425 [Phycisphaerales bacterium]|nr:hypothetical protein [Phycisphaerales bacterium]
MLSTNSSGTKYGVAIHSRFLAPPIRCPNSSVPVSSLSAGPEGYISTCGPLSRGGCSIHSSSSGIFRCAQYQSSRNTIWRHWTAGPSSRTCESRHGPTSWSRPRYSSPTLIPPTSPSFPSTTTILRWLRKFSRSSRRRRRLVVRNPLHRQPAASSACRYAMLKDIDPISSYMKYTATPRSRAAISRACSSLPVASSR